MLYLLFMILAGHMPGKQSRGSARSSGHAEADAPPGTKDDDDKIEGRSGQIASEDTLPSPVGTEVTRFSPVRTQDTPAEPKVVDKPPKPKSQREVSVSGEDSESESSSGTIQRPVRKDHLPGSSNKPEKRAEGLFKLFRDSSGQKRQDKRARVIKQETENSDSESCGQPKVKLSPRVDPDTVKDSDNRATPRASLPHHLPHLPKSLGQRIAFRSLTHTPLM